MAAHGEILKAIVSALMLLRQEVTKVKDMTRFWYLVQSRSCQDRLRDRSNTIHILLSSLNVAQTNEVHRDWSRVVEDLRLQLEDERRQAAELRRQVDAGSPLRSLLYRIGLVTVTDIEESLGQAEEVQRALGLLREDREQLQQMSQSIQRELQMLRQSIQQSDSSPRREPPTAARRIPTVSVLLVVLIFVVVFRRDLEGKGSKSSTGPCFERNTAHRPLHDLAYCQQ